MASALPTPTPTTNLPAEEQEALKAAVFQRLHPRVYFERFLNEKVRPDGREFDAWRSVSVHVGEWDIAILFLEPFPLARQSPISIY